MSQTNEGNSFAGRVASDLSSYQYCGVQVSAANLTITIQTSAGGAVAGILQEPVDGSTNVKSGAVKVAGITKVKCGGTCTRNGIGTIEATTGRFIDATGANVEAPVRFLESGVDSDVVMAVIINSFVET